jgi:uncharacterized protein
MYPLLSLMSKLNIMNICKTVQFVVKTSKYCNLRCEYCYEYAELGNKEAISIYQIESMFRNIASYYHQLDFPVNIEFIWHGGEPLIQHPNFYWQVFDLQHKVFNRATDRVTNGVQTNLTLLDSERLRLLAEGFDSVGVSIDLFGDLRVDRNGRSSQTKVLENMDKLSNAGISFGCITVLTKHSLDRISAIYEFYKTMELPVRILPLFKGAFAEQHAGFEISARETLTAYKQLFDLWMADEQLVSISPISEAIEQVLTHYNPHAPTFFYDKREWESIYLVNTDGEIYSYADAYEIDRSHGNIFANSLAKLIDGSPHQQVIIAAESRLEQTCLDCKYFGSCSGYPIAEGSREYTEIDIDGLPKCIVERGILEYIEYQLQSADILDEKTMTINDNSSPLLLAKPLTVLSYA